jgi:hypothetical protein
MEWSYTFTPPIRFHGVVLSLKDRKDEDLWEDTSNRRMKEIAY